MQQSFDNFVVICLVSCCYVYSIWNMGYVEGILFATGVSVLCLIAMFIGDWITDRI